YSVVGPPRNQVSLRGNVWRPGTYELDSGLTLSALLARAGGPKPDTYLERAHILRLEPDSTRRLIPVSLVPGSPDPLLMELDEVTVYSRTSFRPQRQIAVFGSVQRPGLHTFRDSMTLLDAVILAGGLRDEAYLLEAEISRLPHERTDGRLAEVIRVPLDSTFVLDPTGYVARQAGSRAGNPVLQPYDNVFIRRLPGWELQRNVVVSGEVRFPGRYTLTRRDERITDLLERAGGLTEAAYVRGAQFNRAEARAGRVGIDLERVLRDRNHRDNLILLAGDSLHVPQYQPVVVVEGAVNSPVGVSYAPGRGAGYYVDRAGGYARRADARRTYIVQPNGRVDRRGADVEPGARVVVPFRPDTDVGPNWVQLLTITSGLVTSLLSIIVISRQL
ncbi:MAG TPA: SLBB domain-containing protein, partial [Gemmatimonadales bacterium]|nr:SLBB domain-containing protein [Gemmatimonadales bacterium]